MGLRERLEADQRDAMRQGQHLRVETIRLLRTAIQQAEQERRTALARERAARKGGPDAELTAEEIAALAREATLSDEEIINSVLARQIKQRRESIEAYKRAGRQDLVDREEAELQVLLAYQPEQLSEVEIEALAAATIAEVGARGPRDVGKVMGKLGPQLRGKADLGAVSRIVQRLLAGAS
jgi:uncharacterized protein YqeY